MNGSLRLGPVGAIGAAILASLTAAGAPSVLAQAEPGLWEISRSGAPAERLCLAEPAALGHFEHLKASCSRDVVRHQGHSTIVTYDCAQAGFGHSSVTAVTPRSLRVETQGIADNSPFKYTFQARRVGNCPAH